MTSRQMSPGWMDAVPGCRAGRWEAAGGDRGHLTGRVNTAAPGIEAAPSPAESCACGTWKPRPGPGVMSRWADREEGRTPVAGTGWPKKPTPVAERQQETEPAVPSPSAVGPDNWPDTGLARAR